MPREFSDQRIRPITSFSEIFKPSRDSENNSKKHLLIIEDEESLLTVYNSYFQSLRYTTTTATNGKEALEILESSSGSFDLILTDYSIPGITGLELLQGIKRIRNDIPIILSTGFLDINKDGMNKRLGVDKILPKPVSLFDLKKYIEEILS